MEFCPSGACSVKGNWTSSSSYIDNPPRMTDDIRAVIEGDRAELCGEFCRGCGYCMPCPAGIEINNCARMSLLLRRSPRQSISAPQVRPR